MHLTTRETSILDHLMLNDAYAPLAKATCFVELAFAPQATKAFSLQCIAYVLNRNGTFLTTTLEREVLLPKTFADENVTKVLSAEVYEFLDEMLHCKNELHYSATNLSVFIYHRVIGQDYATCVNMLTQIFVPPLVPYDIVVKDSPVQVQEVLDEHSIALFPKMAMYLNDMIYDLESLNAMTPRSSDALVKILMMHPDENIRPRLLHACLDYFARKIIIKAREECLAELEEQRFSPVVPPTSNPNTLN